MALNNQAVSQQSTILTDQETKQSLWGISWMSFFWSASSLMVFALLPAFLTEVLGASHTKVGIIEGVAIFLAFVSKVFSGITSDIFRTRKPLIALGTIFSIVVKIIFAAASSISWIFLARSIDRLSKGVRSSPADALIADLSHNLNRGRSYGIRQSLYTLGAVAGSFLATILMYLTNHSYRWVFMISTIPGIIALGILITVVRQPKIVNEIKPQNSKWHWGDVKFLPSSFWLLLAISFLLMLARFSEAFITLRAKSVGWDIALLPMLIVAMDLVHAAVAYPMGRMADKTQRLPLFFKGLLVLILANIIFITTHSIIGVFIASLLAGLHMGMTQGLLSTLVAHSTPAELRGTAFAIYYLSSGTAVLIGNSLAGHLSDTFGRTEPGAFYGGLVFTSIAAFALFVILRRQNKVVAVPG
jgi:MFS family permease